MDQVFKCLSVNPFQKPVLLGLKSIFSMLDISTFKCQPQTHFRPQQK